MVKSMFQGSVLCRTTKEAWDLLKDVSYRTYEQETIREAPSIASKIFMDNEGKLPNDFVALEDTMLH